MLRAGCLPYAAALTTPSATREFAKDAAPRPQTGDPVRIPVLVVDDDYDICMAVRLALELEGYMVFEAPDGKPALERLREHPTGMVVLLDPQIPGVDGYAIPKPFDLEEVMDTVAAAAKRLSVGTV